ncbi:MAG: hypothetical protein AUK03_07435 [Anaerolineae bacterium CG2_30_64_16]|nr:MAG: hypothetical protein AUK03_07435 [Anaerolineae bacterium CG2_30_64_16]
MTISREMGVPPHVQHLSQVLRRLTPVELNQLVRLVPELQRAGSAETLVAEQEAIAYFRGAAMVLTGGKLPSPQDEFLEGMTYRSYFALPEASQDALWERIFAEEKTGPYDLEEHDARPDARVAAR